MLSDVPRFRPQMEGIHNKPSAPRNDITTPTRPNGGGGRQELGDSPTGVIKTRDKGASRPGDEQGRRGKAGGNPQGETDGPRAARVAGRGDLGNGRSETRPEGEPKSLEEKIKRDAETVSSLLKTSEKDATSEQNRQIAEITEFVRQFRQAESQGQASTEDKVRFDALSERLKHAFRSMEAADNGVLRPLENLTRKPLVADKAGQQAAAEVVVRPTEGEAGRAPVPPEQPLTEIEQLIANDAIFNLTQNWVNPGADHAEIVGKAMNAAERLINKINNGDPTPQDVEAYRANRYAFESLLADHEGRFEELRPVLEELDKLQVQLPNTSASPVPGPPATQGNDATRTTNDAGVTPAERTLDEQRQATIEQVRAGIKQYEGVADDGLTDTQRTNIQSLIDTATDLASKIQQGTASPLEVAVYDAMRTVFVEAHSMGTYEVLNPIHDALHPPTDNTAIPPAVPPIDVPTPSDVPAPAPDLGNNSDQSSAGAPTDAQLHSALTDAHVESGNIQAVEREFRQLDGAVQAAIMSLPSKDRAMIFEAIADGSLTANQIVDVMNETVSLDNPFASELQRWQEIEQNLSSEAKRVLGQLSSEEQADRKLLMVHLDEERHVQLEALRVSDPEAYNSYMGEIIARGERAVAELTDELDRRSAVELLPPIEVQVAEMNAALATPQDGQQNARSDDPETPEGRARIQAKKEAADRAGEQMARQQAAEKARKDAIFKILLALQAFLAFGSAAAGAAS